METLQYHMEHRHATWLELFFDLVFVASIGIVTHNLAHAHDGHGDKDAGGDDDHADGHDDHGKEGHDEKDDHDHKEGHDHDDDSHEADGKKGGE